MIIPRYLRNVVERAEAEIRANNKDKSYTTKLRKIRTVAIALENQHGEMFRAKNHYLNMIKIALNIENAIENLSDEAKQRIFSETHVQDELIYALNWANLQYPYMSDDINKLSELFTNPLISCDECDSHSDIREFRLVPSELAWRKLVAQGEGVDLSVPRLERSRFLKYLKVYYVADVESRKRREQQYKNAEKCFDEVWSISQKHYITQNNLKLLKKYCFKLTKGDGIYYIYIPRI